MKKFPLHMNAITKLYSKLLSAPDSEIKTYTKSDIPDFGGVYIIYRTDVDAPGDIMYVGRSKKLKTRICRYHTRKCKGAFGRYLVRGGVNPLGIGVYIRKHFTVRYVLEKDFKKRGLLESFATAMLNPKYGIEEEH